MKGMKGAKKGKEKREGEKGAPGKPGRELADAYIKGSYRDKGINTSTKCGEPDGRSSSKSYLFEILPLPPSLSLLFPASSSRSASLFLFLPSRAVRCHRHRRWDPRAIRFPLLDSGLGGTIPPRQTRLGSILPNERRERAPLSLALWKLERGIARARVSAWFLTLVDLFWFPSNGETHLST